MASPSTISLLGFICQSKLFSALFSLILSNIHLLQYHIIKVYKKKHSPQYLCRPQVFTHREAYEQVVAKTEEKLQRARTEYKRAYGALLAAPETNQDSELKRAYLEAHNAYVLQLHATNAISERYQFHCLPGLLGEVSEVYEELCGLTCTCVSGISEAAGDRVAEQIKRYQALAKEVKVVNPQSDLQVRFSSNLIQISS